MPSSGCAPGPLTAGRVIAAPLEGPVYGPAAQTTRVPAAHGASGHRVMTGAFPALGACHLLTARGLRTAAPAGRVAPADGGPAASAAVLLPAPAAGDPRNHGSATAAGSVLLAAWPVLAADDSGAAPWALRPAPSVVATAGTAVGAVRFLVEAHRHGAAGVAERVVTAVQCLWPFVVVTSCLRRPEDRDESPP